MSKASEVLHITQPALSRQLSQMDKGLIDIGLLLEPAGSVIIIRI
ncbi:MAG: LysR family transcriptional regulator [Eubacterium sp.]